MLFDTEFLIHLTRKPGSPWHGRATAFLAAHRPDLYTSRVCWMEFAAGREDRVDVDRDLGRFAVLEVDESVAWQASRLARALGPAGLHIGDNDLWIAGTALNFGLPLVSNNKKHFGRVPGLDLRTY